MSQYFTLNLLPVLRFLYDIFMESPMLFSLSLLYLLILIAANILILKMIFESNFMRIVLRILFRAVFINFFVSLIVFSRIDMLRIITLINFIDIFLANPTGAPRGSDYTIHNLISKS